MNKYSAVSLSNTVKIRQMTSCGPLSLAALWVRIISDVMWLRSVIRKWRHITNSIGLPIESAFKEILLWHWSNRNALHDFVRNLRFAMKCGFDSYGPNAHIWFWNAIHWPWSGRQPPFPHDLATCRAKRDAADFSRRESPESYWRAPSSRPAQGSSGTHCLNPPDVCG